MVGTLSITSDIWNIHIHLSLILTWFSWVKGSDIRFKKLEKKMKIATWYVLFRLYHRGRSEHSVSRCVYMWITLESIGQNSIVSSSLSDKILRALRIGLTVTPQIQYLRRKLSSSIGILNLIKDYIPISLHKNLCNTLFESHLCYSINSWGGVPESILRPFFQIQKRCVRIIFKNKEKYLNKFKTCCRVRPVEEQILAKNTTRQSILNHCETSTISWLSIIYMSMCTTVAWIVDTFKTLKYRIPKSWWD